MNYLEIDEQIKMVEKIIADSGYSIFEIDTERPWGGYYRLKDNDAKNFVMEYFPDVSDEFSNFDNLSPKFLIVKPGKMLSWQYHYRRAEHWKIINGSVGIYLSDTDEQPKSIIMKNEGDLVQFGALERHRLVGLQTYGLVAEIWQHTDPKNPSTEQDIVRVADEYGR